MTNFTFNFISLWEKLLQTFKEYKQSNFPRYKLPYPVSLLKLEMFIFHRNFIFVFFIYFYHLLGNDKIPVWRQQCIHKLELNDLVVGGSWRHIRVVMTSERRSIFASWRQKCDQSMGFDSELAGVFYFSIHFSYFLCVVCLLERTSSHFPQWAAVWRS